MGEYLNIKDLRVSFNTYAGEVQAVRGVSLSLNERETLAIVGESGCGKSVTAKSILRLNPDPPVVYKSGSIMLDGKSVLDLSSREMSTVRGESVGMIFQDPMTSLNPTMTIGRQIAEGIIKHQNIPGKEARNAAIDMLRLAGIPNPEKRYSDFPHQFSGGMRQRAMIAIALVCRPKLLIADEPTTALDVTIQAQILDLMKDLQNKLDMSIILITHDLGVVADSAKRILVMYGGKIVERGSTRQIFYESKHPYTWGLMQSVPRLDLRNEAEKLTAIEGTPPDLLNPPEGCPFADRCEYAMRICREREPGEFEIAQGHYSSCWLNHIDAPKIQKPVIAAGKGL